MSTEAEYFIDYESDIFRFLILTHHAIPFAYYPTTSLAALLQLPSIQRGFKNGTRYLCGFSPYRPGKRKTTISKRTECCDRRSLGMNAKQFIILLTVTFLSLLTISSVMFYDDFQEGWSAYVKKDYETAHRLWLP